MQSFFNAGQHLKLREGHAEQFVNGIDVVKIAAL